MLLLPIGRGRNRSGEVEEDAWDPSSDDFCSDRSGPPDYEGSSNGSGPLTGRVPDPVNGAARGHLDLVLIENRLVSEYVPTALDSQNRSERANPIDAAIPGRRFSSPHREVGEAPPPQALARRQADLDLRLIQPAAVFRRVVGREKAPDLVAEFLAARIGQRFARVVK